MLLITANQFARLELSVEERFALRLALELARFFPFRFRDGGHETVKFALESIRHAKSLGIRRESGISRYANLAALMGIGFEQAAFAEDAGLVPQHGEALDPPWLDRIVPLTQKMLKARNAS